MVDLKTADPAIFSAIENEYNRQKDGLELIASENYVSAAICEAVGSCLTNKYAEGYPSKRYYGGCENVDIVESIAIERLKRIYNCEHANVQPHSGANANFAVYFAMLNAGDKILGMDLSAGGHLTHGYKINVSGKYFTSYFYGVDKNGLIDYEQIRKIALETQPKMIIAGASAYSRIIDFKKFREIADEIGAYLLVDMAHIAGLVAAGLHPSPIEYADFVTSTTHKTLRGPRGGIIMCKKEYSALIDKSVFPGTQGGPLMHIIAGKAVCFLEALQPEFISYQKQVILNAKALANELTKNGINIVSGGTDNHLMIIDLSTESITGKELENLLEQALITTNKNTVPNEKRSPFITSGIRIGTPAITSRGMKETEMIIIAKLIVDIIKNKSAAIERVKDSVTKLLNNF